MERKHNVGSFKDFKGQRCPRCWLCCCFLGSFSLLSICITQRSPPHPAPEFVLNSFLTVIIRDRAPSYFMVALVFIASSLPAPAWIRPMVPQGFHSSLWQKFLPEPSNFHTIIPHHKLHHDLLARWVGLTLHAVTCTDEQADGVFQTRGGVIAARRLPPSVWRAGPPSGGMHGPRTPLTEELSALTARPYHCMLSVAGKHTQSCTACFWKRVIGPFFFLFCIT